MKKMVKVSVEFTEEAYEKVCKAAMKAKKDPKALIEQRAIQPIRRRLKDRFNAATTIEVLNGIHNLEVDVIAERPKTELINDLDSLKESAGKWQN